MVGKAPRAVKAERRQRLSARVWLLRAAAVQADLQALGRHLPALAAHHGILVAQAHLDGFLVGRPRGFDSGERSRYSRGVYGLAGLREEP
jgi:hypothetical protein